MTASIDRLHPVVSTADERVRRAALALSRMPAGMATAIEVVGLDGAEIDALAATAERVATEFGLVAVIELEPTVVVRLERDET